MTTNSIDLFVNPTAGRGRAGRRLAEIRRLIEASGASVIIHESGYVGDLETQVRDLVSSGVERIIVAGGDGSIHEAVNGIMDADTDASLGIVPSGTGNDFAKAAGIPLEWRAATTLLASRIADNVAPRTIDVGRMNDRYFANGAGIGLDAKVTRIARDYNWPIGDLVYLVAILRTMLDGIATPEMQLEAESLRWDGPLTLASVSNGPWIGGMFHIAPMARNDDGKLELMIADPVSRRRIVTLLPKLMSGKHLDEAEIRYSSVTRLSIESSEPLISHLDGEIQPLQTRFELGLLPAALRLL